MSYRYYRNREGYPDPTAGAALENLMREQRKQTAVKNRNIHGKERRRANRRMKNQRTGTTAVYQNNGVAKEV